jgi:propanediol dehydratase large subunit
VLEDDVIAARHKAAKVLQAMFRVLGLTEVTDEEVEAATYARGSDDVPARNVTEDLKAADNLMKRGLNGVDIVKVLAAAGYDDVAGSVFNMLKQRVVGDYLQTSAILTKDFGVLSAVNVPNDYRGPKTGYQITPERWELLKTIRQAISPESI